LEEEQKVTPTRNAARFATQKPRAKSKERRAQTELLETRCNASRKKERQTIINRASDATAPGGGSITRTALRLTRLSDKGISKRLAKNNSLDRADHKGVENHPSRQNWNLGLTERNLDWGIKNHGRRIKWAF